MTEIVFKADVERPNRGWITDQFSLFQDDDEIGYLRCENIPKDNVPKFYPNGVVDYMDRIGGWCGTTRKYEEGKPACFPHINHNKEITTQEVDEYLAKYYQGQFEGFLNYHVDKPFDQFIRIHERYQRQGHAELLILSAVKHYREQGLEFYLSTCRNQKSELFAHKLIAKYNLPYRTFHDPYIKTQKYYFPLDLKIPERGLQKCCQKN